MPARLSAVGNRFLPGDAHWLWLCGGARQPLPLVSDYTPPAPPTAVERANIAAVPPLGLAVTAKRLTNPAAHSRSVDDTARFGFATATENSRLPPRCPRNGSF